MTSSQNSANSTADALRLFQDLWTDYTAFNPRAKRVYDLLLENERKSHPSAEALVNDHVALRTFAHPRVGEVALGSIFEKLGYKANGEYVFKAKKLFARHYEHEDRALPKVFISELRLDLCSPFVQEVAGKIIESLKDESVRKPGFLHSRRSWEVSYETYQKLLAESEYAAWLYAFGYRANHFTVSLNHMQSFETLEGLNKFIRASGYEMNTAGGEIKGTPAQFLEQSSTLAEPAKVDFKEGAREIPACYYEFAQRYPLPTGELFQGFIEGSADKIFESTNVNR